MLAVRSFAAPARRQCLQASARLWVPASSQVGRQYATAVKEKGKVAEFHGKKGSDGLYTVSLIEGDGIGPEISQSVKDIFAAAKVRTSYSNQLIGLHSASQVLLTNHSGTHQVGASRCYTTIDRWQDLNSTRDDREHQEKQGCIERTTRCRFSLLRTSWYMLTQIDSDW